jgi:hypothetical protein
VIPPGPILPATAAELSAFLMLTERNRQMMEARTQGRLDRFPARVDNYRSSDGRYSWTEQTFDSFGVRRDMPGGRTGSFAYSPAYAYGGGVVTEFPHPTWLTRRVIALESGSGGLTTIGPVYEFPLPCACLAGDNPDTSGDGSGASGGGYVLVACCPNPLPRTLYLHLSAITIPFLDGKTVRLVYVPGTWPAAIWQSDPTSLGAYMSWEYRFNLTCDVGGWRLGVANLSWSGGPTGCIFAYDGYGGLATPLAQYAVANFMYSCDPFLVTYTDHVYGEGAGTLSPCVTFGAPGAVTFYVTE